MAALESFEFTIPDLEASIPDSRGRVTLEEGVYEYTYPGSASGVTVQLVALTPGDLDGDQQADAAAVLTVETGGTGTFVYLVAVLSGSDGLRQGGLAFLGDRVQVRRISIQDGAIHIQRSAHAPDDPMCCPSLEISESYTLTGDMLVPEDINPAVEAARLAIQALQGGDLASLAALAHPELGVRFSPYAYVQESDQVFSPQQIASLGEDPSVYAWGYFDGSGEPIRMIFPEYFERFVYSQDFANPDQISVSRSGDPNARRLGWGNTLDNSLEYFGDVVVVEFYIAPQNPDYGGLDWQSLRLVFQKADPTCVGAYCAWYLVGVIHDEWTI